MNKYKYSTRTPLSSIEFIELKRETMQTERVRGNPNLINVKVVPVKARGGELNAGTYFADRTDREW